MPLQYRHHQNHSSSSSGSCTDPPLTSCVSTPAKNTCTFLAIRIQTAPKTALQLVKHQTIMCQLFSSYPAASALKYDRLFQEAAARSKPTTFQLDVLEEDILVWCVTHIPFHARQQVQAPSSTPCQGSALAGSTTTSKVSAQCTPALARISVVYLTTGDALREPNATMPTSAGVQVVVGTTLLQPALTPSSTHVSSSELTHPYEAIPLSKNEGAIPTKPGPHGY